MNRNCLLHSGPDQDRPPDCRECYPRLSLHDCDEHPTSPTVRVDDSFAICATCVTQWGRLADGATPGPWRQGNEETYHIFTAHGAAIGPDRVLLRMNMSERWSWQGDAAFIAVARTAVPALVAAISRFAVEHDRLRGELALEREELAELKAIIDDELPSHDENMDAIGDEVERLQHVGEMLRGRAEPASACARCDGRGYLVGYVEGQSAFQGACHACDRGRDMSVLADRMACADAMIAESGGVGLTWQQIQKLARDWRKPITTAALDAARGDTARGEH